MHHIQQFRRNLKSITVKRKRNQALNTLHMNIRTVTHYT